MELVSVAVGCLGSIIFLILLARIAQRGRSNGTSTASAVESWSEEWFSEFSAFRYLPMQRLLSEEDENYYLKMTGGPAEGRSAFRSERRRLYGEYLELISADFRRLSQGLRIAIVHAPEDQTREVQSLLRLEWEFRKLLFQARMRLACHWLGVRPSDATALINAMQGLEFGLREMQIHSSATA